MPVHMVATGWEVPTLGELLGPRPVLNVEEGRLGVVCQSSVVHKNREGTMAGVPTYQVWACSVLANQIKVCVWGVPMVGGQVGPPGAAKPGAALEVPVGWQGCLGSSPVSTEPVLVGA